MKKLKKEKKEDEEKEAEDGWSTVKSKEEKKEINWNDSVIEEKLNEIIGKRGIKSSNAFEQIENLNIMISKVESKIYMQN